MSLVLDSSVTIARVISDECNPIVEAVFLQVALSEAWVPEFWKSEVPNSLSVSIRRKRLTAEERDDLLAQLRYLPIHCDRETGEHCWGRTQEPADQHKLTIYDATYLELAMRLSLPLATLDDDLRKAAKAERVPLLGL